MTTQASHAHRRDDSPSIEQLITEAEWEAIAAALAGVSDDNLATIRKAIERALRFYRVSRKPDQDIIRRVAKLAKLANGLQEGLRDTEIDSRLKQLAVVRADPNIPIDQAAARALEDWRTLTSNFGELLGRYQALLDALVTGHEAQKPRGRGGARNNAAWREEWLLADLYGCFAQVQNSYRELFPRRGMVEHRKLFIHACVCAARRTHPRIAHMGGKMHERALARARALSPNSLKDFDEGW